LAEKHLLSPKEEKAMLKLNEGQLDHIGWLASGIDSCRLCFADKPFNLNRSKDVGFTTTDLSLPP
jgi:hypothetical protein